MLTLPPPRSSDILRLSLFLSFLSLFPYELAPLSSFSFSSPLFCYLLPFSLFTALVESHQIPVFSLDRRHTTCPADAVFHKRNGGRDAMELRTIRSNKGSLTRTARMFRGGGSRQTTEHVDRGSQPESQHSPISPAPSSPPYPSSEISLT